jgi:hypothetical protein
VCTTLIEMCGGTLHGKGRKQTLLIECVLMQGFQLWHPKMPLHILEILALPCPLPPCMHTHNPFSGPSPGPSPSPRPPERNCPATNLPGCVNGSAGACAGGGAPGRMCTFQLHCAPQHSTQDSCNMVWLLGGEVSLYVHRRAGC